MMSRFLVRIALLTAIVAAIQLSIVPSFTREWRIAKKLLRDVSAQPDVAYFCDSTNRWTDDSDSDLRSISEMTQAALPELTISAADREGLHAGVFELVVELLAARNQLPDLLVVPINLRSFSPTWDRCPCLQFEELQNQIRYADQKWWLGLLAVAEMFPRGDDHEVSAETFKRLPVYRGSECIGCVGDFENKSYQVPNRARTTNKFIYHYMYPLTSEHRRLQSLVRLASIARQHGCQTVFYITPVDVDSGNRLIGPEFETRIKKNIDVIRSQIEPHASLLNLAFDLPSDAFAWHLYPNEHLNQYGRSYVASAIEDSIAERIDTRHVKRKSAGARYASRRDGTPRLSSRRDRAIR